MTSTGLATGCLALLAGVQRLTDVRDTIFVDLSTANDDALEFATRLKRAEAERDQLKIENEALRHGADR
jgi:hypothetical protein